MLHILDYGKTFQVRWGMVEPIAKSAGLPHLWTADGWPRLGIGSSNEGKASGRPNREGMTAVLPISRLEYVPHLALWSERSRALVRGGNATGFRRDAKDDFDLLRITRLAPQGDAEAIARPHDDD
jgi:hypothetical protein